MKHKALAPTHSVWPSRGAAILDEQGWAEVGCALKLSGRELQIMRAVFDDRTEFAIAADLGISPHTVHTHFRRLHKKLGAITRVQLVLRAMDEFIALNGRAPPDRASEWTAAALACLSPEQATGANPPPRL